MRSAKICTQASVSMLSTRKDRVRTLGMELVMGDTAAEIEAVLVVVAIVLIVRYVCSCSSTEEPEWRINASLVVYNNSKV